MSNVSDIDVGGLRRRPLAVVSLAVLIAAVLGGCSVSPETAKPQVRTAVAKQNNTYVVRRASVRTPATARAYKHQQQSRQRAASVRKARYQAAKRKSVARPAVRKQTTRVQQASRKKQTPVRQVTRSNNGQRKLTSAQYHARYQAQQQAAAKAAQQRRHAKARALATQQRAKQQAVRKQHIAKWQQQQNKRRQYNNSWKYKQAQKAINSKRAVQAARRRPAAPAKPWVKPRPRPTTRRPVVRNQQPNRQMYLARWQRMQEEKRLKAQKAQADKRLKTQKAAQKVERVIHNAKKQIGRKYVWGGASPRQGFDCSGLVQHSIKKGANVRVPRTAAQQYKASVKVPKHQAERGDLVFFITRGKSVSHVGIYLGNNKFVHAPRTGKRVTTSNLSGYWKKRFVGFGRIPGACRLPI